MTDPLTGALAKAALGPAVKLVSTGAVRGVGYVRRYFSPTILIAGQHNAGKTTLSEYFRTGAFPPRELSMDETQEFKSRLVEVVFNTGGGQKAATFWVRDSRGFFDANPLAQDVRKTKPVFIFFVFDIKKIEDAPVDQTMKYEFVQDWVQKFKERVDEHFEVNSNAKKTLCGAAVLINKCDKVDEVTFRERESSFDRNIRPLFRALQPKLGVGDQRLEVFYTCMLEGGALPRPGKPESDFQLAIDYMYRMLSNGGVIK